MAHVHTHSGQSTKKFVDIKKAISLLVSKDKTFLDIGCGPGDYVLEASTITKNCIGVDTDAESIKIVKSHGLNGILADATKNIPLKDNSVDSILVANVLHGFIANGEYKTASQEMIRVLKKGGLLGIIEFKKTAEFGPPSNIKLSPEDVKKYILPLKFSKISIQDVGPYHYMIVFKKN